MTTYLLVMTTLAPNLDNIVVIPLPNPVPPPVINAVFPLKHPSGNMGVFVGGKNLFCSPTKHREDVDNFLILCDSSEKELFVITYNITLCDRVNK